MFKFYDGIKGYKPIKVCRGNNLCQIFNWLTELEGKAGFGLRIAQAMIRNRDMYKEACLSYDQTKEECCRYKMERLDKEYEELKSFLHIEEDNYNKAIFIRYMSFGSCPLCGAEIMDYFNNTYCGNCGKRIKWSNTNKMDL